MKEKSTPVLGMLSLFISTSVIVIVLCILCVFLTINPILGAFLFLGISSLVIGIIGIIKEENKVISIIGVSLSVIIIILTIILIVTYMQNIHYLLK